MLGRRGNDATRLREVLESAVEKHNRAAAADALRQLSAVEPGEPRWPHRLGETLARLGKAHEAEVAYVHAATMYAEKGFLARAIAVAKLAVEINPERAELLARLDPAPAQSLREAARPVAAVKRASPVVLPSAAALTELSPVATAEEDELRFEDAPQSCTIEVQEIDFDLSTLDEDEPAADAAAHDDAELDAERLARMAGATLFADVPREALADIAHEAERVVFPDGAVVLKKGEPSDALLVIVEGRAEVRFEGRPPIAFEEGDVFGETSILEDAVRTADVHARSELITLRVGKSALDRIIAKHPAAGEVLFGLLARHLVANALETSALFAPFDPATRADIARSFEVRRARAGTVLQQKGKKGDALYLLLSGALDAGDAGATERLPHETLLGPEMLVARAPAPRTVTVAKEAVLLRLPATKFTAFVTEYPPALAHLAELAASG